MSFIKPVALLGKSDVDAQCLDDGSTTEHRRFSSKEEYLNLAKLALQEHR